MSTARNVSLGMGMFSMLLSVFAGFAVWLLFRYSPQGLPFAPTLPTATSLASASCESLQAVCPILAGHVQTMSDLNDVYFRNYEKLVFTVLFGTLGWGALSGAGFLFIYARLKEQGRREDSAF